MAKDKQKKYQAGEAKAASDKMKRKEFEKELAKLASTGTLLTLSETKTGE